ncbi:MAG: sulfatase-like hydrolase/transferase [Myxococcales bacterium]|nr:sulfatase-like hydrolase/transferase [Myxococcales bacterium]
MVSIRSRVAGSRALGLAVFSCAATVIASCANRTRHNDSVAANASNNVEASSAIRAGSVAEDAASRAAHEDATATDVDASQTADSGASSLGLRGTGPLNVLYLTIDSLRSDALHPRGALPAAFGEDPARFAPTLAALARRAVVYTRAYALSSYTSMSVGGMYGGRYPGELPRDGYFFGEYRPSALMLAERLSNAGVHTMGAHAHFYFRRGSSGLEQGFARWEIVPGLVRNNTTDVEVTSDRLEALCERLLSEPAVRDRPWFLHAHFMDPHDQYRPHRGSPPPVVARGSRALYLGELWFTDQHLARLLSFVERQPWASRTAIIISADHGEAFGEHGHFRHGFYLWEELVRVPWMFVVPGATPRVIDVARSHIDLAPTILDLLGVPAQRDLPGISLRDELMGAPANPRVVWVDLPQTSDNDRWRARIDGDLSTIARGPNDGTFYVYDLRTDPEQRSPLARTDPRRAAAIEQYRQERGRFRDVPPDQWRPTAAR